MKRYLTILMSLCEDKLKRKTAHFQLPSMTQKRRALKPLFDGKLEALEEEKDKNITKLINN